MTQQHPTSHFDSALIEPAILASVNHIPPAWPLASSVAVNPFLGQSGETLAETDARLSRVGGIHVTMPRDWYLDRIRDGAISIDDLSAALQNCTYELKPADIDALMSASERNRQIPVALPTVVDLAAKASDTDWTGILADRFGSWASSYFDEGQALWPAVRGRSAWSAWVSYAAHDLTPEILGLKGFASFVAEAPEDPRAMIARAVRTLGLEQAALETYFHQLLLSLGGWAQYARYLLWRAELASGTDSAITDLLAIRLAWEEALFLQYRNEVELHWESVSLSHAAPPTPGTDEIIDEILQDAAERSAQRDLASKLAAQTQSSVDARPLLQAAFCIDVRSEVIRRALEALDPSIRTIGFAGFFGVSTKHRRFASDVDELHLPVLLNPSVSSCSGEPGTEALDIAARYRARAKRAWGRFKLAAISSFAFVEATGPIYLVKLLRDALGFNPAPPPNDPAPQFDPPLDLETRIASAETVLRAMSLTSGFGHVVLLAGHGANVVNNPFASGLHCGACGGYSGDVNARLLAGLLNDPEVRDGLKERDIKVPKDTVFVAALHDTTTDRFTLFDQDLEVTVPDEQIHQVRRWLEAAGQVARAERAHRLPRAAGEQDIARRALDWAEVRPEWALAGCKAFIAAPRHRTAGKALEGRAFLHDYDWQQDRQNGYPVLELILTAPVVVASWISLQYYGSAVAPQMFGSGNKLLHNVVGGIGVFEGNSGNMRAGLAWQSVHDGEQFAHEPLRLSVCIEAPPEAMTDILDRHPQVRALFDNGWLHLFAIDSEGQLAERYSGDLMWSRSP